MHQNLFWRKMKSLTQFFFDNVVYGNNSASALKNNKENKTAGLGVVNLDKKTKAKKSDQKTRKPTNINAKPHPPLPPKKAHPHGEKIREQERKQAEPKAATVS